MILAFHGGGMQGEGMRRLTHLDDVADARDVVVIYPDGVGRHWNDGRSTIKNPQDDVRFITAIIDRAQHDYHVNPHQVYATGISNGALFAERLGCDLSERIGGIAAVAGTMPVDIAARCRPSHPVAVLQIDGNADPIMPFEGGAVADFGGAGEGGQVLSVAATVASWAQRNGCARAEPAQLLAPVAALDRTRVSRTDYAGCAAGAPVTAYTVLGGGHTWPGGPQYARPRIVGWASMQLDASSTIVDFFLAQTPRAR
ncbi:MULTISPECIES: PHB depolymerase family esterase [unclassified Achromobacter]|uniref:alpha/beta hydrolase family esterase n=1 Tax=unclassified Achromobacter TaxID=2626865 RepID=UPI000B5193D6|nr:MULTISPECIES: esterase [unclassified Achromobacter]OWT76970.1 esterase [Achromobacter sp. HZ28]OWT77850.1 esterase [Achromobacter sp. HZ34]